MAIQKVKRSSGRRGKDGWAEIIRAIGVAVIGILGALGVGMGGISIGQKENDPLSAGKDALNKAETIKRLNDEASKREAEIIDLRDRLYSKGKR